AQERMKLGRIHSLLAQLSEHHADCLRVGPSGHNPLLRTAHPRGSDHLHRPGHLGHVPHAADPPSDVAKAWHLFATPPLPLGEGWGKGTASSDALTRLAPSALRRPLTEG